MVETNRTIAIIAGAVGLTIAGILLVAVSLALSAPESVQLLHLRGF